MAEENMPQFRRNPATKLFIAEIKETTHQLPKSGEDHYEAQKWLTPTGIVTAKVVVCATALEKEDVGTDQSFWRLRIADPTGGISVYAGQYQPEAALVIASLDIPCHIAIVGKISIYEPDERNKVISIRPDNIVQVSTDTRDSFLIDAAEQLAARIKEPKDADRVKEIYPDWDSKLLTKCVADALRGLIEPGVEQPARPPVATEEKITVPEEGQPPNPTDTAIIQNKPEEKKETKKKERPPAEKTKKKETPPAEPSAQAASTSLDAKDVVLEIIKSEQKGCQYEKLFSKLKEKEMTMIDVDGAIKRLMGEGKIYEPKIGTLKVTP